MCMDKPTNIGKILIERKTIPREVHSMRTRRDYTLADYLKNSLCYSPIPLEIEVHIDWKSIYDIKHECVRQVGFLSSAGVRLLRGLAPSTRGPG